MNNSAQNQQVSVYANGELLGTVDRERARGMRDTGEFYFANHGKELRKGGIAREHKTREELIARLILPGFSRTALNRGRCGQFPIGYPIPYAFEGHIKMPLAAAVNACG